MKARPAAGLWAVKALAAMGNQRHGLRTSRGGTYLATLRAVS